MSQQWDHCLTCGNPILPTNTALMYSGPSCGCPETPRVRVRMSQSQQFQDQRVDLTGQAIAGRDMWMEKARTLEARVKKLERVALWAQTYRNAVVCDDDINPQLYSAATNLDEALKALDE